jgi:hypothetical protein
LYKYIKRIYTGRKYTEWYEYFEECVLFFCVDFLYYSYRCIRVRSLAVGSATASVFERSPCSFLWVYVGVWILIYSNAGFAVLDIRRCGSVSFRFL